MPGKKKTFKEIVENHPLTVTGIFTTSAVAATFSVLSYFNGTEEKIHQEEFQRQLTTQKESLNGQIAFLQGRLSSIERKVGSEGPSYLDLSSLTTTPDRAGSLTREFEYLKDIKIYVAVPRGDEWKHEIGTEFTLIKYMVGASLAEAAAQTPIGKIGSGLSLHIWKGPSSFEVNTGSEDLPKLTLFPFVAIEAFDNDHLAQLVGRALADDKEDSDTQNEQHVKALESLSTTLLAQTENDKSQQPSTEATPNSTPLISQTRLAITNELSSFFRSDFAGFVLYSQLAAVFSLHKFLEDSTVRLLASEKKGNVLYAHFLITFIDAKSKSPVFWDKEVFFVSGSVRSVVLLTGAPSIDRRPAEGAWISSWLGSVRIPIE
jgi:hypothetical protein